MRFGLHCEHWRAWLQPWKEAALGLLYPPGCRLCDLPLHEPDHEGPLARYFCQSCAETLPRVQPPCCEVCGDSFAGNTGGRTFRCDNCRDRRFSFSYAVAAYHAKEGTRELIHRYKYEHEVALAAPLALMLAEALADVRLQHEPLSRWTLVPVPLHHQRQREREYNQAWELCRQLAQTHGLRAVDALRRLKATGHQAELSRPERLANLRSAFAMKSAFRDSSSPLRGASVLLVDDVFTTGATTDACARVLRRQGGVEKVVVVTVARG